MYPVLFTVPFSWLSESFPDVPVYGYGFMLFVAFVSCTWLGGKLGKPHGIPRHVFQDLTIWLFVTGIVGARLTYVIQYRDNIHTLGQVFALWDGGLVFYGSFFGGGVGFLLVYYYTLRPLQIDFWKMLDIIAPCLALGLCIGRVGCLLFGCCYGNVAGEGCPRIHFPMSAPPRGEMVKRGHQSPAGFTLTPQGNQISKVEPGSEAEKAGLKPGDTLVKVNDQSVHDAPSVAQALDASKGPRGKTDLALQVRSGGKTHDLPLFVPRTIGLHPTQIYETISMALLLFFLTSLYRYRPFDGFVMTMCLFVYAVHRFLNEMLRTDTEKVAFDMTLSQNISIVIIFLGIVIAAFGWRRARAEAHQTDPRLTS